jgi:hypothetical protein
MAAAASAFFFVPLAGVAGAAPGAGPAKAVPLTVRPFCENLPALVSPPPLTRVVRSLQSLNDPFCRSPRICVEIVGPMPLIDLELGLAGLVDVDRGEGGRRRARRGR